jgi:hypothetical protein
MNEVILDYPGHILDLIFGFAYTGRCNVTSENVEQLLPIADPHESLSESFTSVCPLSVGRT